MFSSGRLSSPTTSPRGLCPCSTVSCFLRIALVLPTRALRVPLARSFADLCDRFLAAARNNELRTFGLCARVASPLRGSRRWIGVRPLRRLCRFPGAIPTAFTLPRSFPATVASPEDGAGSELGPVAVDEYFRVSSGGS